MSGNTLAGKIGKSQNYVAVRLRDEKPFTLDDVELISDVLAGGDAGDFINYAVDEYIGYVAARQSSTPPQPAPADDAVVVTFPAAPPDEDDEDEPTERDYHQMAALDPGYPPDAENEQ
nr:hypothetical protein [Actinomyces sp.]